MPCKFCKKEQCKHNPKTGKIEKGNLAWVDEVQRTLTETRWVRVQRYLCPYCKEIPCKCPAGVLAAVHLAKILK